MRRDHFIPCDGRGAVVEGLSRAARLAAPDSPTQKPSEVCSTLEELRTAGGWGAPAL
jgi:hypothetical protein